MISRENFLLFREGGISEEEYLVFRNLNEKWEVMAKTGG